jgi:hypothetical protein
MDDPLHNTSAVIFFAFWALDMILVTIAYYRLRKFNPESNIEYHLFKIK